ncbi:MAG: hypothetical protein HKN68_18920 [Saprospiraceae bacterium]|nr:hypothetical protein [Saprospiraceae bacterium]
MTSIPETLDGKLLSEKLEKLFVDSSILGELVKGGGSDDDLKKAIYALHDVFHGIVGLCDEH